MKTLRDEWFGDTSIVSAQEHRAHSERLLKKYGSYRVVEGVLHYDNGQVYLTRGTRPDQLVGNVHAHVKLILPPEEKEVVDVFASLRCPALDAYFAAHPEKKLLAAGTWTVPTAKWEAERARVDRYERVLKEISDEAERLRTCKMKSGWGKAYQDAAQRFGKWARGALDEDD